MKPDLPAKSENVSMAWGSDAAAEMLRHLGIDYVCVDDELSRAPRQPGELSRQ